MVLLGLEPSAVGAFRLDMVALYSLVHLAVFVLVGAAATALYSRWAVVRRPVVLVSLVTGSLTVAVLTADALLYPGIVEAVGRLNTFSGNLAAAAAMTWVLRSGLGSDASDDRA